MAKFNVGVGDAFPVEAGNTPRDEDPAIVQDESCGAGWRDGERRWRRRHRGGLFKVTLILLMIWLVLDWTTHTNVKGLLIAAGITGGLAVINWMFSGEERRRRRREERQERRRPWGER